MSAQSEKQRALAAIKAQRFGEAASLLATVLKREPGDTQSRWLRLNCLDQLGDRENGQQELDELLYRSAPDVGQVNALAEFARQRGYSLGAVAAALKACDDQHPGDAGIAYNLAWYQAASGDAPAAVKAYERALELGVQGAEEVHLNLANLYMDQLDQPARARLHLDKALTLRPDYPGALHNLGNLEEREGNREAAQRCFKRCLELDPADDRALARLADAHVFSQPGEPLLERLTAIAPQSQNPDLHYARGRALDQVGEYDAAWAALSRANTLDRAGLPAYRPAQTEDMAVKVIEGFSRDWLDRFPRVETHRPVFLCGMFRSGTTLLERMLAAHPAFAAGGESEFFPRLVRDEWPGWPEGVDTITPEQVADWAQRHARWLEERSEPGLRLTDKRPDNFLYVGLIKAVVPGARFVVTERDWRDVLVSVFATRLGAGQAYAADPADIRHYLGLHRQLVDHWEGVLGNALLRVAYEDLVSDPRATLGRVLEHLGEPWDDACLAFHEQQGAVATASVWQVREPLHTRSVGRWKNYAGPLRDALGAGAID
ncbi:tetratricopeptide repeat-containing sulfotransferase family protein [Marinihelvus fidelis]|nr:tetratricopeptide repeat-containing sulfotransferase family protein [Marinihelvus fidelis]